MLNQDHMTRSPSQTYYAMMVQSDTFIDWTFLLAAALGCAGVTIDEEGFIDDIDFDWGDLESAWVEFLDEMIEAVKNDRLP